MLRDGAISEVKVIHNLLKKVRRFNRNTKGNKHFFYILEIERQKEKS